MVRVGSSGEPGGDDVELVAGVCDFDHQREPSVGAWIVDVLGELAEHDLAGVPDRVGYAGQVPNSRVPLVHPVSGVGCAGRVGDGVGDAHHSAAFGAWPRTTVSRRPKASMRRARSSARFRAPKTTHVLADTDLGLIMSHVLLGREWPCRASGLHRDPRVAEIRSDGIGDGHTDRGAAGGTPLFEVVRWGGDPLDDRGSPPAS
jgi:hypothetical protein